MDKYNENNSIEKIVDIILCCIFLSFNIILLLICGKMFNIKDRLIQSLKSKLYVIVIFDNIMIIYLTIKKFFEQTIPIIIFFLISNTVEYAYLLLFIYQVINNTKMLKDSPKIPLKDPILLSLLFFLTIFPYHELFQIFSKLIYILETLIFGGFLIFLYKYFQKTLIQIGNNIVKNDYVSNKVYFYLEQLNLISFIAFLFYDIIAIGKVYNGYNFQFLLKLVLRTIFEGIKYFSFAILIIILYTIKNMSVKSDREENVQILSNSKDNSKDLQK